MDVARQQGYRPLSTVGENEEANNEYEADFYDDGSSNKFEILCEGVTTGLAEAQSSLEELLSLKDDLLLHFLPPPLLFRCAVVVGKLYRSFSDLNTPINELTRLVRVNAASWDEKSIALRELQKMYNVKKEMLNEAIKRLTLVDQKTKLFEKEKRIMNWEKLFIKINEAKGHGRRWKFHMELFRKKASEGYENLIHWIDSTPRPERSASIRNTRKSANSKTKKSANSNKGEVISKSPKDNETIEEVDDSDKDSLQSFRTNDGHKPALTVEQMVQTEPDVESKNTWTGEPDYIRYVVVRLYRPVGINARRMRSKISLGNTSFLSKYLDAPRTSVTAEQSGDSKKRTPKSLRFKKKSAKKDKNSDKDSGNENEKPASEAASDEIETIFKYEDFVFSIDDQFKRKEVLNTTLDDQISFELVHGDDNTTFGFANIPLDDLQTLDLPIMYYKTPNECQVVDFYSNEQSEDVATLNSASDLTGSFQGFSWLKYDDLTEEAVNVYRMLSQRQPLLFPVHTHKSAKQSSSESIGSIPITLFILRKPIVTRCDKNTGTQTIDDIIRELLAVEEAGDTTLPMREYKDESCSPFAKLTPFLKSPNSRASSAVKINLNTEELEFIKQKHIKDIEKLQQNHDLQISRLTLIISELEEEIHHMKVVGDLKYELRSKTPKNYDDKDRNEKLSRRSQYKEYGRDLADNFLERLKAFNERSDAHHKEIIKKYLSEEARIREQQMSVHHRLDTSRNINENDENFCLPAVFMPYKSQNNIYNPKAHQYFHPVGHKDYRLTQPPSMFELPALPNRSAAIINLFDFGNRYQTTDFYNRFCPRSQKDVSEISMGSSNHPLNSLASKNDTLVASNSHEQKSDATSVKTE